MIKYAAHAKKQNNAAVRDLETRINIAQSELTEPNGSSALSSELSEMIMQRDEMFEQMTRDSMDRNQARWRHFAERGTAYFHGLNKRYRAQTPLKCMAMAHSIERPDIYSGKTSDMLNECKTFF